MFGMLLSAQQCAAATYAITILEICQCLGLDRAIGRHRNQPNLSGEPEQLEHIRAPTASRFDPSHSDRHPATKS